MPLWNGKGNIFMDEEKAKVPNTFFVSLFVRSVVLQVPSPQAGRLEPPIIQGEKVSDLLHHLATHRSMGLAGITQGFWGSCWKC